MTILDKLIDKLKALKIKEKELKDKIKEQKLKEKENTKKSKKKGGSTRSHDDILENLNKLTGELKKLKEIYGKYSPTIIHQLVGMIPKTSTEVWDLIQYKSNQMKMYMDDVKMYKNYSEYRKADEELKLL